MRKLKGLMGRPPEDRIDYRLDEGPGEKKSAVLQLSLSFDKIRKLFRIILMR